VISFFLNNQRTVFR